MRAEFALFHCLDHVRDVFIKALLHLRELRFQLLDALVLSFHPFRAQFLSFLFERMPLGGHLLLHAVQFIAAAMQIGDEVGGFARFWSQQHARAFDDSLGDSQPLRDGNTAGTARHAHHQTIGWLEVHIVKFDCGVHHARRCRSVSLQPVVMRGG